MTKWCSWLIGLTALILASVVLLFRHVTVDTNIISIFPKSLPSVQQLDMAMDASGQSEWNFLIVNTGDKETALWELMVGQVQGLPAVEAVEVTREPPVPRHILGAAVMKRLPEQTFIQFTEALNEPELKKTLNESLSKLQGPLSYDASLLVNDPLNLYRYILKTNQPQGSMPGKAYMRIRLTDKADISATADELDRVLSDTPGSWLIGGPSAYHVQIEGMLKRDLVLSSGIVLIAIAGLYLIIYRSLFGLLIIVAVQVISLMVALLVSLLFYPSLNIISISFACIILGVGIDFGLLCYHAAVSRTSEQEHTSIRRSIAISAVTTVAAALALQMSDFPGIRQLSILVSVGLGTAAIIFTAIPGSWWTWRSRAYGGISCQWLLNLLQRRPGVCLSGMVLLAGLCLISLSNRQIVDFSPAHLIPASLDAPKVDQWFEKTYGGNASTEILQASLNDPILSANRKQWHADYTQVAMNTLRQNGYKKPHALPSVMMMQELDTWKENGHDWDLFSVAQAWEALPDELSKAALGDITFIVLMTCAIVLISLLALTRSLVTTIVIIVSVVLCIPITASLSLLLGGGILLLSVLALPLLFGLALDYAVHITLPLLKHGTSSTLNHVLPPLCIAALTTILAFSLLTLSSFPLLQNFGITMASGIVAAFMTASLFATSTSLLYLRWKKH